MSKYHRRIGSNGEYIYVDVYDVLNAFAVICPATQHAIKKLLCAGNRGSKSAVQDLEEARQSIVRAIVLAEDRAKPKERTECGQGAEQHAFPHGADRGCACGAYPPKNPT